MTEPEAPHQEETQVSTQTASRLGPGEDHFLSNPARANLSGDSPAYFV